MSYPGHCGGGGSYPSVEMQSVYSTAIVDWSIRKIMSAYSKSSAEKKKRIVFYNNNR